MSAFRLFRKAGFTLENDDRQGEWGCVNLLNRPGEEGWWVLKNITSVAMKFEKISTLPFLQTIVGSYYKFVPEAYKRYCIVNAQVCQEVLRHFNIPAFLMPSQLWYVTATNNYVVGFVGSEPQPNIWDGHVVCATQDYIFDASLVHLRNEYALNVPDVVIGQRFKIPSHVIARENLSDGTGLWWHDAPAVVQRHPVLEDVSLVKDLARPLIDHLEQLYVRDLEMAFPGEQVAVPRGGI